ncbi:DUF6682 family protein [Stenotrophomonas acidaminiphila]|uniref:phage adaptor protein n=1 Tax=Stenotrophomonas acidaminiphila TaxID=128780 RepID=UPI001FAF192B
MEAQSLRQLIDDCREELDDAVAPYLWGDELLIRYLNEAVEEACIRARLLVESRNPDVCRIALQAGQADYALHPSVYVIRRAALEDRPGEPLCRTSSAVLDGCREQWRTEQGRPSYVIRDRQTREVSLSPVPAEVGALLMTVWRVPTAAEVMESDDDEPVIDAIHHRKLVHWACHRAFNKKDSERYSPQDADRQLTLFIDYFGDRPTARALQQLATDPVSGTSPVWF